MLTAKAAGTRAIITLDRDAFPPVLSRTNLAPTPHGGHGQGGVALSGGVTLAFERPPGFPTMSQPAFKVTATGTQSSTAMYPCGVIAGTMARMGWQRGDTVTVVASIYQGAAQTGTLDPYARAITAGIVRAGVTSYAIAASAAAPNGATGETRLRLTFTIPSDADECFIRLMNGSGVAGEAVWWNWILIEKTGAWLAYFDGDSIDTQQANYQWAGAAGNSASQLWAPNLAGTMTLWSDADGVRRPVPGWANVPREIGVAVDNTVPLNRDVVYVLDFSGGQYSYAQPIYVPSDLPLLTDPVSGEVAPVWIEDWPDRNHETPAVITRVPGRRSPIALMDVEGMPTSAPVLLTRTPGQRDRVRSLARDGDVVVLRTTCPDVEDGALVITSRQESRLNKRATNTSRRHTLAVQEIDPADLREQAPGQTLGDIAAALPGKTLGDLAALFPGGTLLDIASTDWAGWSS